MAKLTLNDITNLSNETSVITSLNNNSSLIEAALENTLSRDGTSPNTMSSNLDMNSFRVTNLPEPVSNTEAVRLVDLTTTRDNIVASVYDQVHSLLSGNGVPASGTGLTGDFYIDTASNNIYGPKIDDTTWGSPTSLIGPQGEEGPQGPEIEDGDRGDITVSSGVWTIDAGVVSTTELGGDITTAGKALLDDASASDQRTTLGLVIGTDVQAQDAELQAIAGLTSAADKLPYFTGSGTASLADFTTAGRSLVDDASASDQRTTLGLGALSTQGDGDKGDITVSGSGATWTIDNDVVTYAKIQNVSATDKLLGRSTAGAGDVEEIACTSAGRALLDDANASAQRTTLGLGVLATKGDLDYGDISVTSSGTVWVIDPDAVTYSKIQNVSATDKVLGRSSAGAGNIEEIACTSTGRAIIAATTSGVPILGTNTNNSASAGYVGEYVTASRTFGSALTLTTATPANVTSISLTAGDWDVEGTSGIFGNSATAVNQFITSISTTSATHASIESPGSARVVFYSLTPFAYGAPTTALSRVRLSLSSTTTVYLVSEAFFAVNSCTAFGSLTARRVR